MIFSIWDNEIEKKEKQKKWTDNFRKIGEEVYTFFVDTVIEKGYENREGQWDMSCEITDALWILRMTEDILIWLYQTGNIND